MLFYCPQSDPLTDMINRVRMTTRGKVTGKSEQLAVLNNAEQEALYGLPDFDDAQRLDQPVSQVAFTFGLLSLALASSLAGKLQERFGVCRVTQGAGIALGRFFLLTDHVNSLVILYLCVVAKIWGTGGAGGLSDNVSHIRGISSA